VKRKIYTSRGEKRTDFFIGYFVTAVWVVLLPTLGGALTGGGTGAAGTVILLVAGLGFLVGAGVYRPWMAVGGLGCLGTLIALGLLGALFIAVTCSSSYR